ncbi:MAG: class I SAM-dependent methyltransferase [Anaerolineae bacterium]|nr:class I SAM-dependent methyltransferase [Anaerolineae bacterium]
MIEQARRARMLLRDGQQSLVLNLHPAKRRQVVSDFRACATRRDIMAFTKVYLDTGICQLTTEIESALDVLAAARPRTVCEIGTATGGNALLLSHALPDVDLFLGIDLYVNNKAYLRLLRPPLQRMVFFDNSSYAPETIAKVSKVLSSRKLDVLFIDGDHRYDGVKSDFLQYRHFVTEGGYILFHDIMPDRGDGWFSSGGVPVLWNELKALYPHQEFVEDPDQQGFGIGMLRYSADIPLPLEFDSDC